MGFFDDIGKKVSDAGQKTLQKTRDVSDIVRVNSLISDEERKVNNAYHSIGKLFVSRFGTNCDDEFLSLVNVVIDSEEKIKGYKKQIQDIKGVTRCTNCGAEVPKGVSFCSACGAKVTQVIPTVNMADTDICTQCGAAVKKGVRFCTSCGAPMQSANNVNIPPQVQTPPVTATPVTGRVCPDCGAQLDEDSVFCTTCGARLD
jgi:rRNA maturation endonuclease Nob1